MRVRIRCTQDNSWILGKFTNKLVEHLGALNVDVDYSRDVDLSADVNHHLMFLGYEATKSNLDTVMITHVDNMAKVSMLIRQLSVAEMGIAMSRDTVEQLTNLGVPRSKLCYVNPAHDGVMVPRKMVVGMASNMYDDGRKREYMLATLVESIPPSDFSFMIMGSGWGKQVEEMRKKGFSVEYFDQFEYNRYVAIIPTLDYYLYLGQDEGQMGFVDAAAAGVKTIVTPQGYHLDAKEGLTNPFNTMEELIGVFKAIAGDRQRMIDSVKDWTWRQYAEKHLSIWTYLLSKKAGTEYSIPNKEIFCSDGINSVEAFDQKKVTMLDTVATNKLKQTLYRTQIKQMFFKIRNLPKSTSKEGVKVTVKRIVGFFKKK